MLAKDGSVCVRTNYGAGVISAANATGRTAAELAAATCTLYSVQDGDAGGMLGYINCKPKTESPLTILLRLMTLIC